MRSKLGFLGVIVLCGSFTLLGCNNSGTDVSGTGSGSSAADVDNSLAELEGEVKIDGSSTVAPISMAAADAFRKKCPKVKVPVGISGTGGGFKRFTKGETAISDASRPIKDAEYAAAKENNVSFIELPVAYDGLTIIANKECDWVDEMTIDQLKQIFLEDSAAKKWSDVNSDWPEEDIMIFLPGTDSGTFDYFKEVIAGDDESFRSDMSPSEDDHVIVKGVSENKYAFGFLGASYYFSNEDKLKALAVVDPKTEQAVLPTPETIEDGSYAPFSRPLFIYVNSEAAKRLEVRVFVEHYLNNGAELATQAKYVGLPQEIYDHAMKNFKTKATGTHYWDADGNKRSGALTEIFKSENLN